LFATPIFWVALNSLALKTALVTSRVPAGVSMIGI
jgi:hypothetical protein